MLRSNYLRIVIGTGALLLIPLIAMLFTSQVDWGREDFIIMGALLITMGFLFEFISSKVGNRLLVGAVILVLTLYVWAELAVGIFTTLGS